MGPPTRKKNRVGTSNTKSKKSCWVARTPTRFFTEAYLWPVTTPTRKMKNSNMIFSNTVLADPSLTRFFHRLDMAQWASAKGRGRGVGSVNIVEQDFVLFQNRPPHSEPQGPPKKASAKRRKKSTAFQFHCIIIHSVLTTFVCDLVCVASDI